VAIEDLYIGRMAGEDAHVGRAPASGRLVVCPTPIGNLEDVTLRVLCTLGEADVLACEDMRHTRILLDRHGIRAARLVSLHEHNERARVPELVARAGAGETVALVSDAGMPVISDPGFLLVRECLAAGIAVEVLPGASAVPVAVVASGLPAARWCFVGFLPRKRGQRERLLADATETLVAFESPKRLPATLEMLAQADPHRPIAVCRELTKLHEEVARGSAVDLAKRYRERPPKGEVVLVVGPSTPSD
jgi:16S rRNA (cytidine1402-2'-O)-methyltransferase